MRHLPAHKVDVPAAAGEPERGGRRGGRRLGEVADRLEGRQRVELPAAPGRGSAAPWRSARLGRAAPGSSARSPRRAASTLFATRVGAGLDRARSAGSSRSGCAAGPRARAAGRVVDQHEASPRSASCRPSRRPCRGRRSSCRACRRSRASRRKHVEHQPARPRRAAYSSTAPIAWPAMKSLRSPVARVLSW